VINVQRFAATGLLTAFSGAGRTIGFDKNPLSFLFTKRIPHIVGNLHEIERNQVLIASFTDDQPGQTPKLYPNDRRMKKKSNSISPIPTSPSPPLPSGSPSNIQKKNGPLSSNSSQKHTPSISWARQTTSNSASGSKPPSRQIQSISAGERSASCNPPP
jgi:hypothetical protein